MLPVSICHSNRQALAHPQVLTALIMSGPQLLSKTERAYNPTIHVDRLNLVEEVLAKKGQIVLSGNNILLEPTSKASNARSVVAFPTSRLPRLNPLSEA